MRAPHPQRRWGNIRKDALYSSLSPVLGGEGRGEGAQKFNKCPHPNPLPGTGEGNKSVIGSVSEAMTNKVASMIYLIRKNLKDRRNVGFTAAYFKKLRALFRSQLKQGIDPVFVNKKTGPKHRHTHQSIIEKIFAWRKQNYSIADIKGYY